MLCTQMLFENEPRDASSNKYIHKAYDHAWIKYSKQTHTCREGWVSSYL